MDDYKSNDTFIISLCNHETLVITAHAHLFARRKKIVAKLSINNDF